MLKVWERERHNEECSWINNLFTQDRIVVLPLRTVIRLIRGCDFDRTCCRNTNTNFSCRTSVSFFLSFDLAKRTDLESEISERVNHGRYDQRQSGFLYRICSDYIFQAFLVLSNFDFILRVISIINLTVLSSAYFILRNKMKWRINLNLQK